MEEIDIWRDLTIEHYQNSSHAFWEGTKDHDVTQNYAALQSRLPARTGMHILDLGCGPGRDLKYFKSRGHFPIGLDACENFCEMARTHSGCEVWHQDFCKMDLPLNHFHGIFANASLFHVPKIHLSHVLNTLYSSLQTNDILFSSNPRGSREYFDGKRYGNYMEFTEYKDYLEKAHFTVVDHYYRPTGWPREEQPWLAVVAKKDIVGQDI